MFETTAITIKFKSVENVKHLYTDLAKCYLYGTATRNIKQPVNHLATPDQTLYALIDEIAPTFKRFEPQGLVNKFTLADIGLGDSKLLPKLDTKAEGALKFTIPGTAKDIMGLVPRVARAQLLAQMESTKGAYYVGSNTITKGALLDGYAIFDIFPAKNVYYVNQPPIQLFKMAEKYYPEMIVDAIPSHIYDEEMEKRNAPLKLPHVFVEDTEW